MKEVNLNAWSKEASDLVLRNLVREVVGTTVKNDASSERPDGVKGAALPAKQLPLGTDNIGFVNEGAEPLSAAKLPKDQSMDISKKLDSGIVEAAKASVSGGVKTAADEEPKEDEKPAVAPVDSAPVAPVAPEAAPMVEAGIAPAAPVDNFGAPVAPPVDPTAIPGAPVAPAAPAPVDAAGNPIDPNAPQADFNQPAPLVEACGIKLAASNMGYGVQISAEEAALLSQIFDR